jgi:hypothetical protein
MGGHFRENRIEVPFRDHRFNAKPQPLPSLGGDQKQSPSDE